MSFLSLLKTFRSMSAKLNYRTITTDMRFLLLLIFSVSYIYSFAQIKGTIKDLDEKPITSASVLLHRITDSVLVKTAVTNKSGSYNFSSQQPGKYFLKVSNIGYKEENSTPFDYSGSSIEIPTIVLEKKSTDLAAVVVKAQKPVIEVKADKMIFNVESNAAATGMDGIELLRLSPGVLVDHEDNISIAGKSGVQIFIDGKPSPLTAKDLASYLRSLRANAIEAIEVINNPSAKYDASGTGGIINIKLKKNSSYGTNGSFNSDYQQGKWARFNNALSLNNRNKYVNLFGNYNYARYTNEFDLDVFRHVLDSLFDGYSASVTRGNSHNFKLGMDRFVNKFSTIGFLVSGNIADDKTNGDNITYIKGANTNITDRVLVANNKLRGDRKSLNGNINYQYNNKGRTLNIDADYGLFRMDNEQFQPNEFYNPSQTVKLSERNYTMITPSDIDIWSLKADYEQDFKKGKLAIGFKSTYINSDNTLDFYNHESNKLSFDSLLSNHFLYRENINAVYTSYNKGFKNIQLMFGLRLEQTSTKGTSTGFIHNGNNYVDHQVEFTRNLLNLFPSGNITFTKNPKNQWTLSYSRRINRPSYQNLNPFEIRGSEYGGFKGNPELKPEIANTFSIINVIKSRLVTNLSFTLIDDVIVNISDTFNGTKSFYFPKNLAQQKNVSLSMNYNYNKNWFTLNTGATGFYTHNKADFGPGRVVDLNVAAVTVFVQPSVKLGKGWSTNFRAMYESPKLFRGTMKQDPFFFSNMGVQKMLLEDRATFRVNFNDVFKTAEFYGTSDFAGQYLTARAWWDPRRVVVSFSYRFGSNQIKASRQRRTGIDEEARRTESSQ